MKQAGSATLKMLLALALLFAGTWAGLCAWRAGAAPRLTLTPELPGIGRRTPVTVVAEVAGRGLSHMRLELVQGDRVEQLAERTYTPRPPWAFWGPFTARDEIRVEVGRDTLRGLRAGDAVLRATAGRAGAWLRHPPPVVVEVTLPVRLAPPTLYVASSKHYVAQGGAELVVYRVGESAVSHGVRAGDRWFPGYPLPGGGPHDRFAFFAVPYDLADPGRVRLVARDDVANEAEVAFVDRFFPKPFRNDTIELTDAFMAKVVPEILSQSPELADRGDLLQNYLQINRDLRRSNAEALDRLARESRESILWSQPFLPPPGGQVMSSFADRRTYVYGGREVDRQDHLGFDLASTQRAPVPAANDGVVALAEYFGIYGNTVVLDHGYGLMTLYAHLSSIDVAKGQQVARGHTLGRSGATGLAGGDHLHFTVLLQGLATDPREWWDPHWIGDRVTRKLDSAASAVPAPTTGP
jgi:murein DD-endopeptidase MepM/ murein hydrolase activator NlpD